MTAPPTARDAASAGTTRLYLFGPMRGEQPSGSVDVPAGNAQRLLAYLVLHPRTAHRREALVDLLWGDVPADQGRRALSDTIYRLRASSRRWLRAEHEVVALERPLWTDVWEFDRLIASADPDDLAAAVDLYGADLAPAVYDDWIIGHRSARRQAYLAASARLVEQREQQGDLLAALVLARQLIAAEPLDEEGHQAYLRLLGRLRRYEEAVAHFDELQRLLDEQIGADPQPETVAIVNAIATERDLGTPRDEAPDTPFVGRIGERATALAAVDAALGGRGSIVAIEGPAGIGKSRLFEEVLSGARWRGATIGSAGVSLVPEASALAPLANALAPLLRGPLLVHVESMLDGRLLATLADLHAGWRATAPGPVIDERAEDRLAHALRSLGSALASAGRIVIGIDDMHRATTTLWRALVAFADGFVSGGGLMLVTYRRPDVEQTEGWEQLREWDRTGTARVITLAPFGIEEVSELLAQHDADPEQVLALTGGVPFYVATWSERSGVGGDAGNAGGDVATLVESRLRALAPQERAALEAAAVIGDTVAYRVWVDATERAPMELAVVGETLAAARWLTPADAGYSFTHDLVRSAVYALTDPDVRTELHQRVADSLATREPHNTRARAFHLDRGGRDAEAATMYIETGRRAHRALAFRDAIDAFERALELMPESAAGRLGVQLELAESCEVIGDRDRQLPLLAAVLDGARAGGDDAMLVRTLVLAGGAAGRTDDPAGAEQLLGEAAAVARRLDDPLSTALVAYRHADVMGQRGRWSEALRSLDEALEHARRAGDLSLLGGVLRMRGIAARFTGDASMGLVWLEEAVDVHRAAGDPLEELNSAANLTGAYYHMGAWDALLATTDALLPSAVAYGDPSILGILLHQSGLAAMALGDPVTARARMVEARDSFAGARRQRLVGLVTNTIGLVAEDEGDVDEALELYSSALATADEIGAATESAYASHDLGALLVKLGRADEAIPLLERALATWERHENPVELAKTGAHLALARLARGENDAAMALSEQGLATLRTGFPPGEQVQGWLWTLSRALDALGRRDEARAVLIAAGGELDRQAEAIADPQLRRRFLEKVPQNRAIVDALAVIDGAGARVQPTVVEVTLASADAPLGRALRPDEQIPVHWTVAAPDDELIADEQSRRRHRLVRLLSEASACGAAPTDDDLARALGVSRRTILRDMAALDDRALAGSTTRRRLRSRAG